MMKTIALLAVAALGLAACGSSSKTSSSTGSASNASASASGGGYGSSAGSKTTVAATGSSGALKIQMKDDFFSQKTITGKPGSTVKVALTNVGSNEHNFKIDGQKADADVEPGKSATVSVKIPTSGTVQFYCEYHKGLGMVGTVKPT
jgi:plastocyanin